MPKKAIDYSRSCIYKICCKDPLITDIYVGSTTDLVQRRYHHKRVCMNPNMAGHNSPVYRFIREHGGFGNWEVVKIEDYDCDCGEDLLRREREVFERLGPTLNKNIPFVPVDEREERKREREREWRERNSGYMAAHQKEYREKNKQHIAARRKDYYESNKHKLNQKCECPCGGRYTLQYRARHFKTKRHTAWQDKQGEP